MQGIKYLHDYPTYEREVVKGVYLGYIDWNPSGTELYFYVNRLLPDADY